MTAREARELLKHSTEKHAEKHQQVYNHVIVAIKKAVEEDAKSELWWDGNLHDQVIKMLRQKGYSVVCHSHRNETCYKIDWREPPMVL